MYKFTMTQKETRTLYNDLFRETFLTGFFFRKNI